MGLVGGLIGAPPRPLYRLCFPPLAASNISIATGCHLDVFVRALRTAPRRLPAVFGGVSGGGGWGGGRRAAAAGLEPPGPAAAAVPRCTPPPPLRPLLPRPPLPPRPFLPALPRMSPSATVLRTSPASHATPRARVPLSAYVPTLCSPPARVTATSPPFLAVPLRVVSAFTVCTCTTTLRIASLCCSLLCRCSSTLRFKPLRRRLHMSRCLRSSAHHSSSPACLAARALRVLSLYCRSHPSTTACASTIRLTNFCSIHPRSLSPISVAAPPPTHHP